MVAQNCVCPGFSTLIYLLTTSVSESTVRRLKNNPKLVNAQWMHEYLEGASMEIYSVCLFWKLTPDQVPLSDAYIGYEFGEASHLVFEKYHSVLFGMRLPDVIHDVKNVFLNPQGYVFKGGEIGYFIATHARDATKVAQEGPVWDLYGSRESPLARRFSKASSLSSPTRADPKHASQEDIIPISPIPGFTDTPVLPIGEELAMPDEPFNLGKGKSKIQTIKDHVLICDLESRFPNNLASFLGPFRVKEPARPVVILCPCVPTTSQWKRLEAFKHVFFVEGTALSRADLNRASALTAWKAVILAKRENKRYS